METGHATTKIIDELMIILYVANPDRDKGKITTVPHPCQYDDDARWGTTNSEILSGDINDEGSNEMTIAEKKGRTATWGVRSSRRRRRRLEAAFQFSFGTSS